MEKSIKLLKKVLFLTILCLFILFFNQSLVEATSTNTVTINGQELTNEYKYLVNGVRAENGILGIGGCTAQFDSDTGVLTLNGYSGGRIQSGQGDELTIKLIGNNKITENTSYQACGIVNNTNLTITSDSEANLTINVTSSESIVAGIESDYNNTNSDNRIVIGGKANIIVNGTSNSNRAIGIHSNSSVSIIDNASFTATLRGYYNSKTLQCGFEITKPLLINTTGNINLDASYDRAFNWPCNGYGIYSTSTMTLHNVGTMTIKYPTINGGAAWNDDSWTVPEKFAVNEGVVDGNKTMEIHSGSGTVHTLTLESAVNMFGKSTGQYFNGDIINIFGNSNVPGLKFKDWTYSTGLIENNLAENTTYTMPDSNATVTANYTPFASQPKFTRINSSTGNINYTLNGEFIETERRLVKSGETAEDDFSIHHEFLNTPYEISEGTEIHQVPAGNYKVAVKYEDKWYYSDAFTVNYDEQISEDDIIGTNDDGQIPEDNTIISNETLNYEEISEEIITGEISNDNKLPQTGTEEGNKFTKWLTAVIFLGIFCLISMLLIDYKKEKINQSQKGGKHNGSR